jgi:hypothetical protein
MRRCQGYLHRRSADMGVDLVPFVFQEKCAKREGGIFDCFKLSSRIIKAVKSQKETRQAGTRYEDARTQ